MEILYDYKKLNKLLTSLSAIINSNICIYDENFNGTNVANLEDVFCSTYIKNGKICGGSDAKALLHSTLTKKPFYYECPFGFIEMLIYYELDKQTVFYVCVGPFRNPEKREAQLKKIKASCKINNESFEDALRDYDKVAIFSEKMYNNVLNIIDSFVLLSKHEKYIHIKNNFLADQLDPYLLENIEKKINIDDIAKHFYFSTKQLEYSVKNLSGMSPRKYITKFKMNIAKEKIITTDLSLPEIAASVGFDDYNYFIKVFKSFFQETPLKYKQKFSS
ncbi:MAG: helix-turn-helix domain-containing protein [Alphaproteobacteria bacterium]|nr:helix-turn-helix domain-containing protein [Alphaproteobacteria bacterium]